MKICIPTVDDDGLDARISDHFGSAPFYTLVESDTGMLKTVRNTSHGHGHGHGHRHGACRALNQIGPDDCDAVACKGLGRGAMASLGRSGLKVYVADGEKVSDRSLTLEAGFEGVLQVGKRKFCRVRVT